MPGKTMTGGHECRKELTARSGKASGNVCGGTVAWHVLRTSPCPERRTKYSIPACIICVQCELHLFVEHMYVVVAGGTQIVFISVHIATERNLFDKLCGCWHCLVGCARQDTWESTKIWNNASEKGAVGAEQRAGPC